MRWRVVCLLVLACPYAASLALPMGRRGRLAPGGRGVEYYLDYGWEAFVGCFQDPLTFSVWLANPALWLGSALLAAGYRKACYASGLVALGLASAAGLAYALWLPAGYLREGYWLWLACPILLLAIASCAPRGQPTAGGQS